MCLVVKTNHVKEVLHLSDGRKLTYVQVEGAFSNPNGHVNEKALDWICSAVNQSTIELSSDKVGSSSGGKGDPLGPILDLLELYCGNGNHTVAIAGEIVQSHMPILLFHIISLLVEHCVAMIFLIIIIIEEFIRSVLVVMHLLFYRIFLS